MSQEQPRRPQSELDPRRQQAAAGQDPTKNGDVFDVSGDLASRPVAPRDAALMQSAEAVALGQTQKGGPAAVMQAATTVNQRAGQVQIYLILSIPKSVSEIVKYTMWKPCKWYQQFAVGAIQQITIGEALEAAAHTAGAKPLDQSDTAAIRVAEIRATGFIAIIPGGLA
ncbi:LOW QUALITY PROTEIN: SMP domain-containing protein, partial [Cephalotus follicularis]